MLWGFAFLSYVLRTNMSVAQQFIAPELHLNDIQIGYVFTAFLIGYTIFQAPAGMLGDRLGPRLVLCLSGVCWAVTTFCTGWFPGIVFTGALALGSLLAVRFAHGLAEASTYPVAMTAVSEVFQPKHHAFVNSLIFTGSTMGAAFAPPLVAFLMTRLGWRPSFCAVAVLPALLAIVWWAGTRRVNMHPAYKPAQTRTNWVKLFAERDLVLLCTSYLLYCYAISIFVYWLFKYLVDVRHLSVMNSGWSTSLPWIAATVAVPITGAISARLSERRDVLTVRRIVAVVCLLCAAALMAVGVNAASIVIALGAIALSVALLFSTEASYFSSAIYLSPEHAGASSGLMNFAGNLGGVFATSLVPVLVAYAGWPIALLSGSVIAVAAALVWIPIRRRV